MSELTGFEQAYFVQTRQEIQAEERARGKLLIALFLVLSAVALAALCSESAQAFLQRPEALAVLIPALPIVSTLVWVRRGKLQRIADGWCALQALAARQFGPEWTQEMLEGTMVSNLARWRPVAEDFALNIVFALPIYWWLLLQASPRPGYSEPGRLVVAILAILAHVLYTWPVLGRRLRTPSAPPASPHPLTETSA